MSKPKRGSSVLPEGALPCVWMTAGVISYKLCDRDYDCEHCPLDAALAGADGTAPVEPAVVEPPDPQWEFPEDRRYHRTHGWARTLPDHRVRIGLDGFAARLLAHATSVVLPTTGSHISQGKAACWLQDDEELIPLCAPVSGTVLSVNRNVQDRPGLIAADPYGDGWLLEARCGPGKPPLMRDAGAQEAAAAEEFRKLHERAARHLARSSGVGNTLPDGGEQVTELRQILGPKRYHRLILPFLR
jgi:glycine cleavage system H protein